MRRTKVLVALAFLLVVVGALIATTGPVPYAKENCPHCGCPPGSADGNLSINGVDVARINICQPSFTKFNPRHRWPVFHDGWQESVYEATGVYPVIPDKVGVCTATEAVRYTP